MAGPRRTLGHRALTGRRKPRPAATYALQAQFRAAKTRGLLATERALPFHEAELADLQRRIDQAKATAGKPLPSGRLAAYQSVGLDWSAPPDAAVAALVQRYDQQAAANMRLVRCADRGGPL